MTIVIDDQSVQERVAAGATVLDRVHPGWEHEVNPATVHVVSQVACPLGQVYGDWITGLEKLEGEGVDVTDKGTSLGFQSALVNENPDRPSADGEEYAARWREYGMLDAHWRNAVEARRQPLRRKKAMNLW